MVDLLVSFGGCWVGWLCYYWLLTLDLGPCDWTTVPVIGFATPVIGLRSLWLDYGPCDWTSVPVIGLITPAYRISGFWLLTSDFWLWVWLGMMVGMRVWRLELGFFLGLFACASLWIIGWYLVVLGYGWLFLMVVVQLVSWLWFIVVLCFRCWILALFGLVLVYDSFSLLLLSIRFELLNSLLVFIFYMGV